MNLTNKDEKSLSLLKSIVEKLKPDMVESLYNSLNLDSLDGFKQSIQWDVMGARYGFCDLFSISTANFSPEEHTFINSYFGVQLVW